MRYGSAVTLQIPTDRAEPSTAGEGDVGGSRVGVLLVSVPQVMGVSTVLMNRIRYWSHVEIFHVKLAVPEW